MTEVTSRKVNPEGAEGKAAGPRAGELVKGGLRPPAGPQRAGETPALDTG